MKNIETYELEILFPIVGADCIPILTLVSYCLEQDRFVVNTEIQKSESFDFVLFFKIILVILDSLQLYISFRVTLPISTHTYKR